ncbi:cytochrome c3 family protein [bacterium]|nr:cytochrome c3 family protein [bacterium]
MRLRHPRVWNVVGLFATLLPALWLSLAPAPARADADACLMCHDDPGLTSADGRSLHMTADALVGSVHDGLDCTDCHLDGNFDDAPHWPAGNGVDCASCHDQVSNLWMERFYEHLKRKDFQGVIPSCSDCHGSHQIKDQVPGGNVKTCGKCHPDQEAEYRQSYHAQRYEDDPRKYPTCVTCHDPHFKGKKELMGETAFKQEIVLTCARCHQKDIELYVHSTHYRRLQEDNDDRAPSCVDCHESHAIRKPSDPKSRVNSNNISRTCDGCHPGHRASLHRKPDEAESQVSCTFCHTGHQTDMTSIANVIYKAGGIFNKCNYCHNEHSRADSKHVLAHSKVMDKDLAGGDVNCSECHVYHWKVKDATGHERKSHPDCANCHAEQNMAYMKSIHGRARAAGIDAAPTCTTCHGDAQVLSPETKFTPEGVVELCSSCHANKELMLSFEINPYVVEGFKDTYHGKLYGLMTEGVRFAVCTNCHGHHSILEPESEESSVNRAHIVETCRQCHPKAEENFVSYLVHPIQPSEAELAEARAKRPKNQPVLLDKQLEPRAPRAGEAFQVAFSTADRAMKLLFVVVLGFFGFHTILWFQRGIRPRLRKEKRYFRRFTPYERFLHILVNVSFLMLCLTGLPQSYVETVPGKWFLENMLPLHRAQQVHYIAAAITGLYFLLHIIQLALKLRQFGWRPLLSGPDSMVPQKKDFFDFVQHIKWFFGKAERPRFDRWTYWEKFDYFAVFWGVAVIGLSGLIRWREEFFGNLLGGGVVSLADTVHKEEALMAAAFIFIVHFFNTHLRSEKFPMDVSIYTGLVSEEEMKDERPEQWDRLTAGGVEPQFKKARPIWAMVLAYAWGTFALLLGLLLLTLIIIGFASGGPH